MGHVRRVDAAHALAAEVEHGVRRHRHRLARRLVVDADHHADAGVRDLRVRCNREEVVHGPALVGLVVTEGDPAQLVERRHRRHGLAHEREHRARSGVEQQGFLLAAHDELVEREARRPDVGHEGGEAENAVADLVDASVHGDSLS